MKLQTLSARFALLTALLAALGLAALALGGPGLAAAPAPDVAAGTATSTATPTAAPPTATPTTFPPTPLPPAACAFTPTWQLGQDMPSARYLMRGATASDGNFYVPGGYKPAATNELARYTTLSDTWTMLAPMPVALGEVTVASAGGRVYVAGGSQGAAAITDTLQIYDIATDSWTLGARLPIAMEAAAGAIVDGKLHVLGGDLYTAAILDVHYVYDIAANTWTTASLLPAPRTNVNAVAAGGLIYVLGGFSASGAEQTFWVYDPATDTWDTSLPPLPAPGYGNWANISTYGPGRLLAMDGGTSSYVPSSATHIYEIATRQWRPGPSLNQARLTTAQGELGDGRVISAGGFGSGGAQRYTELLAPECPGRAFLPLWLYNAGTR